jgi:acetyl-CoA decarbonylase/synthase complex subunit gamma
MCRISNRFRMRYKVDPGLYSLGNPGTSSPVFVSANYRLSFNALRGSLKNSNSWILVLDTKGINVWCAAGKGTFGTAELINRINNTGLSSTVKHRTIIVPQLGAPGVAAHEVKKETGFNVLYGPVRSRDIPAYLAAGNKATEAMRIVNFTLPDRSILTPMEFFPAFRKFLWVILGCLVIMGMQPIGILYKEALRHSMPIIAAGLLALITGSILTPILLPFIPFRSFAAKGALTGAIVLSPLLFFVKQFFLGSTLLAVAVILFFTAVSSYLALNFTGCTPFTSMSGVKKEMRFAVPAYLAACGITAVLLIVFKLQEWGVL